MMCMMQSIQSCTLEQKQQQGPFVAKYFFLWEPPKQYRRQDAFYYATLNWKKEVFEGKCYWKAEVLAINSAERDEQIFQRAMAYMRRSKLDWDVHAIDYWSTAADEVEGLSSIDYCGRPIYRCWLREHMRVAA